MPVTVTIDVPDDLAALLVSGSWLPDDRSWKAELRCFSLVAAAVKRAPRPIAVGDTVKTAGCRYKVTAIDDDATLLRDDDGRPYWDYLRNLTRVEDET